MSEVKMSAFWYLCRKMQAVRFMSAGIIFSVKNELRLVKKMLIDGIKADISNYFGNILINLSDVHSFYHTVGVKRKLSKFKKVIAVQVSSGVTVRGESQVAEDFAQHFERNHSLTFNSSSSMSREVDICVASINSERFIKFSREWRALPNVSQAVRSELISVTEVKEVIDSRNNKLSAGADGLPNRILKLLDDRVLRGLTIVFNQLLAIGNSKGGQGLWVSGELEANLVVALCV